MDEIEQKKRTKLIDVYVELITTIIVYHLRTETDKENLETIQDNVLELIEALKPSTSSIIANVPDLFGKLLINEPFNCSDG